MKVTINKYRLNISKTDDLKEYKRIKLICRDLGYELFDCISTSKNSFEGFPTIQTIDPTHLFSNQYNTIEGYRLFDWYESIYTNPKIKAGYYLTGDIDTLREAKNSQLICGYCSHRSYDHTQKFCDTCLDSERLERKNLYLLRLLPVSDKSDRPQLTQEEENVLVPLWHHNQTIATDSRNVAKLAKQRVDIIKKYRKAERTALAELNGMNWFMDHHLPIDNIIYYEHSEKFSIGWRRKLDDEVAKTFLEHMSEFPYPYVINKTDGSTLEGGDQSDLSN